VPILVFDDLVGVFALHRLEPGRWTPEEVSVSEAIAREIGLAVHVAHLLRDNERRIAQQSAFFRIAAMLGQSLSLSETLDALAQAATDAFGGDAAAVLMPRGGGLELAASVRLPEQLSRALAPGLPPAAESLVRAAADRRVVASPRLAGDDRFDEQWQALMDDAGLRALLAVPAASPRADRDGLTLVFFSEEHLFTDEDLEVARHLGDAARGALERSGLFEAERTARALAQQLARTGGLLATELDPAAVLDEVVQQAPALLGAEACVVRVLEDDLLVVSAAEGADVGDLIGEESPATGRLSGDVVQSRAPIVVDDARDDARLTAADALLAQGYASYLGVPLVGPEGSLHGVLAVY